MLLFLAGASCPCSRGRQIEAEEGRSFIHPFEGPLTTLGTATIGLEWVEQAGPLDAVICPIGGGGLIAGLATAIKLLDRADNLESMVRMLPARSDWALRYWRQTAQEVGPLAARCRNQVAVEAYDTGHSRLKAKLKALGLDP